MPRTTLALDEDVFAAAGQYAKDRSISLGKAISDLARRGLHAAPSIRTVNGLAVFDLPADSPVITIEEVKRVETEEV